MTNKWRIGGRGDTDPWGELGQRPGSFRSHYGGVAKQASMPIVSRRGRASTPWRGSGGDEMLGDVDEGSPIVMRGGSALRSAARDRSHSDQEESVAEDLSDEVPCDTIWGDPAIVPLAVSNGI